MELVTLHDLNSLLNTDTGMKSDAPTAVSMMITYLQDATPLV
jgi:hypothetical protein